MGSLCRATLLTYVVYSLSRDIIGQKFLFFCCGEDHFEHPSLLNVDQLSEHLLRPQELTSRPSEHSFSGIVSRRNKHRRLESLPLGLKYQSDEEKNYLKLHKCRDPGEAYAASYLITKDHLINQFTGLNLTWVNCEMGSFIMMNHRANPSRNVNGSMTQTLDVLDFSVVHLSWYERLQKRHTKTMQTELKIDRKDKVRMATIHNLAAIEKTVELLKTRALKIRDPSIPFAVPELNRTVAVMPFLGSDMGAGHSNLNNRLTYLSACFWSVYAEIPHVVATVKNQRDYNYAMNASGLPFYDVLILENLPKSASLPVATVQQAKARIMDGRWDFDYLYFTESDQVLMMRIHEDIYAHLKEFPRRLMIPHRLNPYPEEVMHHVYQKNLSTHHPMDWLDMNCCLPRQNCGDRKDWVNMKDPKVSVLNIFGLQVALGNVNFHIESYRYCALNEIGNQTVCP